MKTRFLRTLQDAARRFHRDERGNMGVLMLLTVWALLLLVAMIWNTAEATTRRAHVQNAADATAHSAATWMARTTNLCSATNMMICENASAEIMLRAVQPTIDGVAGRLTSDEKMIRRRVWGNTPGTGERTIPDLEYYEELFGTGTSSGNARGTQLSKTLEQLLKDTNTLVAALNQYYSAAQKQQITDQTIKRMNRAQIALEYIQGTWIDGGQPKNGNFPPPPVLNGGQGLRNIYGPYLADIKQRYLIMLNALPSQWAIWQIFVDQTAPAMSTNLDELANRRARMYDYEHQIVAATPEAGEEQRDKMGKLFKCNVALADPQNGASSTGQAMVQPPVFEASVPDKMNHTDSIRTRYPLEAAKRYGTADPEILIDPINIHMDKAPQEVTPENASLWHPGTSVTATLISGGPEHTYFIKGGTWGAIQCAPLARYVNDRVSRDEEGLAKILRQLDDIRDQVRAQIYPVPWLPNPCPRLTDKLTLTTGTPGETLPLPPEQIQPLPRPAKTPPANLLQQIEDINKRIKQFNLDLGNYVTDVRSIWANQPSEGISPFEYLALTFASEVNGGTMRFAENCWHSYVEQFRYAVLKGMGDNKGFMVLKSYKLGRIPEWAKGGVHDGAYQLIYNDVYGRNIGGVGSGWSIYQWNTYEYWNGVHGAVHRDLIKDLMAKGKSFGAAKALADQLAPGLARAICSRGSSIIATEGAAEWIERPWPYEISPQVDPALPKSEGWRKTDRPKYFTVLAGATNTDANKMDFTLTGEMGKPPGTIATFAQAEAFNWMENHGGYGNRDAYNNVTSYGHNVWSGSPAPWRIATVGGWNWQPRLAVGDQLAPALENNPQLSSQFKQGGVPGTDADAINKLIMH